MKRNLVANQSAKNAHTEAIKLRKARLCFCCAETAIYHLQKKKKKKEFTQTRIRVWENLPLKLLV